MEAVQVDESKQILIALSRLEENVKNMNTKIDGFNKISDLALQTDASVKSAHHRLDELKRDYDGKFAEQKKDYEEKIAVQEKNLDKLENKITWLWRTVIGGAITSIFVLIVSYMKSLGG